MPDDDQPDIEVGMPMPAAPKTQSASQELFESQRLKECAAICKHVYNPSKAANQQVLAQVGLRPITDGAVLDHFRADNRFQVGDDGSIVNTRNGLKVSLYKDAQDKVTVGIAGSDLKATNRALQTWANNLKGGLGAIPSHDRQAVEIVQECQRVHGLNNVSVTGHSAGGRAAAYASLVTGAPALTINADGLGPGYQKDPHVGPKINGPQGRAIVQVRTDHDELGAALKVLPNQLPGSNVNMLGTKGGMGHSMSSVIKSIEEPLPNRAELVQRERMQGDDVKADMNVQQANELRAYAIMAMDVYNATKPENVVERELAGVQRLSPERLNEMPGMRAKLQDAGWQVDPHGTITQPKTGLKAALYEQANGTISVSIAGTEAHLKGRMLTTWHNNIKAGTIGKCQHDKEASDLVMMAQDAFGKDRVNVVGHSAGGRAATYAALKANAPAYTFNSDGLGPRYRMDRDIAKKLDSLDAQNITQVRTKQDWLKPVVDHSLSRLPGSVIIVAGDGGHSMKDTLKAMYNVDQSDAAKQARKHDEVLALLNHLEELKEDRNQLNNPSSSQRLKAVAKNGPRGIQAEIDKVEQKIRTTERGLEAALNEIGLDDQKATRQQMKDALQANKRELGVIKADIKAAENDLKNVSLNEQLLGSSLKTSEKAELAHQANNAINVREALKPRAEQLKAANQDLKAEIKAEKKAISVREKIQSSLGKPSAGDLAGGLKV
jgi:hypothetical protein